jgi:hypothetical protein
MNASSNLIKVVGNLARHWSCVFLRAPCRGESSMSTRLPFHLEQALWQCCAHRVWLLLNGQVHDRVD